MPSEVIMLCSGGPDAADLNFAKISQFLGINCVTHDLKPTLGQINQLSKVMKDEHPCVVASGKTLAKLFLSDAHREDLKALFFQKIFFMLVYDLSPADSQTLALKGLVGNHDSALSYFADSTYSYKITCAAKHITKELSGMAFGPINNLTDFNLNLGTDSKHILTLISINSHPFFIVLKNNNSNLFIITSEGVIDIANEAPRSTSVKQYFSQIVPHMMFLKYVFQDMCWHNANTSASFIIDDPLLREHYGFLEYRKLLQVMDKHNYSSTIAFIPWNFKRTADPVAKLFRQRGGRLSLCVHGCNHTEAEFGESDEHNLKQRVRLATERMITHKRVTGISFDKVMVFPQGIFSRRSMNILKANNYLAAVNSIPHPCTELSSGLKILDHLDIAIMTTFHFL